MFAARNAVVSSSRNAMLARRVALPVSMRWLASQPRFLDVTQEIKIDHDNVRDLFSRFKQSSDQKEKTLIANTLIREMSIHGDAEEVSVYNDYGPLGLDDTVRHNKEEHASVKKLVWKAEHSSSNSENYDTILADAVNAFLEHAVEEETVQFPKLLEKLGPEQNDQIARQFIKARGSVPLRPHPLAPQTGGLLQKAMGMHGRVQDKMVEGVQGRQYVELKLQHPEV